MKYKKIINVQKSNLFLTFWLIFLYCAYPVKLKIQHYLPKLNNNTLWRTHNQSVAIISEATIYYFFSKSYQNQVLKKSKIEFSKENFQKQKCEDKNDMLLSYFFQNIENKENLSISIITELEELSFDLLNSCDSKIVQKNAYNILYWISLYYEYKN